jgi:cytochrome oxidase assembly protein ShyY1
MSPRARVVFLLLCLLVAAVCVRLGLWQRSRLHERRASNAAVLQARVLPPVSLGIASWRVVDQQRVSATGTWDPAHQMLIRNQVMRGVPGVVIVTPLLRGSIDSAVLVVRGFVPSPDGVSLPGADSVKVSGDTTVSGAAARLREWPDSGGLLERDGVATWRALDASEIRARLPYPVSSVTIRELGDSADQGFPRRLFPERLDDGPHWSYMMQWFAFATIAVVMGLLVSLRRRAPRWSEPTAASSSGAGQPPPPPA